MNGRNYKLLYKQLKEADAPKPVSAYLLRPVRSQSEAVQHLRARQAGAPLSAADSAKDER